MLTLQSLQKGTVSILLLQTKQAPSISVVSQQALWVAFIGSQGVQVGKIDPQIRLSQGGA
jgi:hypothetical protein